MGESERQGLKKGVYLVTETCSKKRLLLNSVLSFSTSPRPLEEASIHSETNSLLLHIYGNDQITDLNSDLWGRGQRSREFAGLAMRGWGDGIIPSFLPSLLQSNSRPFLVRGCKCGRPFADGARWDGGEDAKVFPYLPDRPFLSTQTMEDCGCRSPNLLQKVDEKRCQPIIPLKSQNLTTVIFHHNATCEHSTYNTSSQE